MDLPLAVSLRSYFPAPSRRLSRYRLVLSSPDGKTRRTLTDGPFDDTDVVWLDDRSLAFLRTYPRAARPMQVCRIDTRTGAVTVLFQARQRQNVLYRLRLAPDRRRIAFLEQFLPLAPNAPTGSDPVLVVRTDAPAPPVEVARGYQALWPDASHLDVSTENGGLRVDLKTGARTKAPDEEARPVSTADGRIWSMVTHPTDENFLAVTDGGGETPVQPDALLRKTMEYADRTLDHLRYLRSLPADSSRLWLRTFDHRAMPTVHARLDPTTGEASFWFTSIGPTRVSPDGKWVFTYPMEEYTEYGKGHQVATRTLLRTPLARPGQWQPLFSGLVHLDSYSIR